MSLETLLVCTCSGIVLAMWTVHVLDYKWDRRTVGLAYLCGILLYLAVELLYSNVNVLLGGCMEFFSIYLISALFARGNVWRNYVILSLGFFLQAALVSFTFVLFSKYGLSYADNIAEHGNLTLGEAMTDFCLRIITAILVVLIFSKIFKKKYKGNAVIYKIIAWLYIAAMVVSHYFRRAYINLTDENSVGRIIRVIVINVALVCIFGWMFGSLYNWFEAKRLERERTKLKVLIQDNYERLEQELVKPTTGQNLSGNLIVDAVIAGYNDFLKAKGIVFESMVQESEGLENVKVDVVMILDYLLSIASHASENVECGSFVWLSIRTIHNSIFVRLDFSKVAELSFRRIGGWHINRELRQMSRKLDTVSKVAESHEGIMRIKDKEDECEVNLVLMR